ncbi:MAG TPA: hypothetical protein VGX75_14225 [bacterium]|nr:hypothetical protein [bacterium]
MREVDDAAGHPVSPARYTGADVYRTLTSVLMVAMGIVILARTLPLGVHLQALLVGLGFLGLGAYRLSFVVAYLRRRVR